MASATRVKGNKAVRKAIELLEKNGWLVAKTELGGKFTKEKDMFGLFDLHCIRPTYSAYIQVTCNRPHTHKPYLEFSEKYGSQNPTRIFEQMVWMDRKGFKVYTYDKGKKRVTKLYEKLKS